MSLLTAEGAIGLVAVALGGRGWSTWLVVRAAVGSFPSGAGVAGLPLSAWVWGTVDAEEPSRRQLSEALSPKASSSSPTLSPNGVEMMQETSGKMRISKKERVQITKQPHWPRENTDHNKME